MAVKIRAGRKSSAEYWRDREAKQRQQNIKDEKEYVKVVEGIYARCIDNCQREIESFYQRYASKEGISLSEAKKRISKMDIAEYERKAAEYVKTKDFSEQANEEMRLYNATMRINRLELLKSRIGLELCGTYSELEKYLGEKMDERVIATFERYAGILGKTVKDPAALAATIVNASFHNATWSDRLWGRSQDGLRDAIGTQLERGMIRGVGSRELARAIRREFDRTIYETERLMVTELARCQTEAAKLSMEANGNTHFIVLTANAAGPCPECIDMELQTGSDPIPVKDMEPGVNAPPLHPSCHCATAPWWDEGKYQRWLDSGAAQAGVPWAEFEDLAPGLPRTSYDFLRKEKPTDEERLWITKKYNGKRDAEQYKRYRSVLKDLAPDSLESFQEIKYNNSGKWTAMKRSYRIVNSYEINAGSMSPQKILQLDNIAFSGKKGLFTGKAKSSANIAVMELDGILYYANSRATSETDWAYKNFKGNKDNLVLMKPDKERKFSTLFIGTHDRCVDSEAKLFEYAADIAADGKHHTLRLLSERCMCDSCLGVMQQFKKHCSNVKVNAVSGRHDRVEKNKNNPWKYR